MSGQTLRRSCGGINALAVAAFILAAPAAASAAIHVRVEFTADGKCAVDATGPEFRASVTYLRRADADPSVLRCAIPGAPAGQPVDLEVLLPGGQQRPVGEFPRLRWEERDGRWKGRARLPAAPAFVRVPPGASRDARTARLLDVLALTVTAVALGWALLYGRSR